MGHDLLQPGPHVDPAGAFREELEGFPLHGGVEDTGHQFLPTRGSGKV